MNTYGGIDLGVKSSAFCIVNEKGQLVAEEQIPTDEKCFERARRNQLMTQPVVLKVLFPTAIQLSLMQ